MREAIGRSFPEGTRVTRPAGGSVVWVELPGRADTLALWERARAKGIGIAPGMLFSTRREFGNCLRLNAACWGERAEAAVRTLGRLARDQR
jgi:DNA-binding transcriptional MocR family regulator